MIVWKERISLTHVHTHYTYVFVFILVRPSRIQIQ